ncbi:MAG: TatD family hydrolase [Oscillospiraceae bacterium]|nr:TatD family hydrolase [Oscillospiraceae bacterium]
MNLKIIDTHAHYDDNAFDDDRYELLSSILSESVDSIITIGTSIEKSRFSVEITEKFDRVYAAVGIHPEDCENIPDDYIELLKEMSGNKKVVAIGEIGLDYHYDGYNKDIQIKIFREQLELAEELNLPVIIHSRDATQDTMEILREYKPKGVMHCFSGSAETAREIIALGMMISFTGVLTFKNSRRAVEACAAVPMERLMFETDCPYMAPIPHRGKRNNSSYTVHTAEKVAEIKGLTTEEVISICNKNAISFFNLKN